MKHIKIILGLVLLASVSTFAQSPRIKLNQITKDTVKGSVLISSPSDSGMVYSRDFYVAYGADTVLILYGDTLAATSRIISSVLSDGVTITGDGTSGNELKVDTATVIATKGDLNNIDLASQVTGTLPITNGGTGATTLSGAGIVTGSGATNYLPKFTGSTTLGNSAITDDGSAVTLQSRSYVINAATNAYSEFIFRENGVLKWNTYNDFNTDNYVIGNSSGSKFFLTQSGSVGIGATIPSQKLEVNGKVKISDLTGTGGNAVYENGGVLGVASDARFKNYIGDIDNGIQKVLNLKPKYFIDNRNSSFQQLGFYAQEVKSVINEASYPIGNTDYLGINDRAILATTVKAIQEQQAIIETQQQTIIDLQTTIQALITRIENLENK